MTEYQLVLMKDGNSRTKKCLGKNECAAKEAETVARDKALRQVRTFDYEGKAIFMESPLKIGVEDDKTKTLRVHFRWVSEKKRIVIDYHGPHLPLASH